MYRDIWSKVESSKGQVKNASEGQKLVEAGTHAFIFDYLINEAAQNIKCEIMAAAPPILLQVSPQNSGSEIKVPCSKNVIAGKSFGKLDFFLFFSFLQVN